MQLNQDIDEGVTFNKYMQLIPLYKNNQFIPYMIDLLNISKCMFTDFGRCDNGTSVIHNSTVILYSVRLHRL